MHFTHKNIALIFGAALIIGGAFGLAEFRNSQKKKIVYSAPIQAAVNELPPELQEQDTDSDGLRDWEEGLLGTDPRKADTDGDGTQDGKEAQGGRNPLVKGPNDKPADVTKTSASSTPLTSTDRVARDFFARYMELNQVGLANDSESQAALVQEVMKNTIVLSKPKSFETKDIITTEDNSTEAIKAYGNKLGDLYKKNIVEGKNELSIAKDSIEADEPEMLEQIDPIIRSYRVILNELLRTPAPSSLAANHLIMVNSINTLLFSSESLRKSENDSLMGIQGASVWLDAATELNRSFNTLKNRFVVNNIVFNPSEPGSFFIPEQ